MTIASVFLLKTCFVAVLLCFDVTQAWLVSKSKHIRKIATAAIASIPILGAPSVDLAVQQNPDAIDVRRVDQEPSMAPRAPRKKAVTLPSGVQYFDAVDGYGKEAEEGKSVQFEWVLRRSNGYFVDSSENYGEPYIYKVGNKKKMSLPPLRT